MDAKDGSPHQKEIERWLDRALRARVDAEPRMGLEERVLTRLAREPRRQAFAWWPILSAAAAVAAIAIAPIVLRPSEQRQNLANGVPEPAKPAQAVGEAPSRRSPAVMTVNKQRHSQSSTRAEAACCVSTKTVMAASGNSRREQLPKLATFPAPQPQTAEERILARLAARRGSFDVARVSNASSPLEELSIPKLEIDPMEGTPPDKTPQE